MNTIWTITRREIASFFDSVIAYILIILFLALTGFFTWLAPGMNIFVSEQASLQSFFFIAYWSLFIFIPLITMRTIAEENRAGTIELLSTKAVNDWEIVSGKFLSSFILVAIALACTIPYYVTVSQLGNVDHGGVVGGYFGLLLLSAAYISLGIFASSVTSNQIAAVLITFAFLIFFQLVFDLLGASMRGTVGEVFEYLSANTHYESMSRGVIDSRDLIYFFSLVFLGLLLSQAMLSRRNWHE